MGILIRELRSWAEVEAFIKTYRHLPGVPSAETLQADGVDVSKMQALMMEKIEELTLYLIEANKKIEALNTELKSLKENKN